MQSRFFIVPLLICLSVSTANAGKKKKKSYPWQTGSNQSRPEKKVVENPLDKIPNQACVEALSDSNYALLAEHLADVSRNPKVVEALKKVELDITTVSWQDTGRYYNSSGGNNISDVRLVAITKDRSGETKTFAQPIIRLPNFVDKTVDIKMDEVFVPVGNAVGAKPFAVSLHELLENPELFVTNPERLKGSLYAARDTEVLVASQAALMPVPKNGEAHFVPSIFNYQSTEAHPAVLVILVSNRGTSMTIIDNVRDTVSANGLYSSGQMVFHNKNGEKAPFVLTSLKEEQQTAKGRKKVKELSKSGQEIAGQSGVDQVMMIQVPLKYPKHRLRGAYSFASMGLESLSVKSLGATRGLDTGVVDVANYTLGKYVEFDGKGGQLERDDSLPVRIDVVAYFATDTTDLTEKEVASIPARIADVYKEGRNLGSLVTEPDMHRVTRNYEPWRTPWWNVIVVPYLPPIYIHEPWVYFEKMYGPTWMYRFATVEIAAKTVATLEKQ